MEQFQDSAADLIALHGNLRAYDTVFKEIMDDEGSAPSVRDDISKFLERGTKQDLAFDACIVSDRPNRQVALYVDAIDGSSGQTRCGAQI